MHLCNVCIYENSNLFLKANDVNEEIIQHSVVRNIIIKYSTISIGRFISNFYKSVFSIQIKAQCSQNYYWTTWQTFLDTSATGVIKNNGEIVNVTITANFAFGLTSFMANHLNFNGILKLNPYLTVPTTMWTWYRRNYCNVFDQTVTNPVFLLSS